jgi:acetyltransferase-like isoleucine patch superfamily enzyme
MNERIDVGAESVAWSPCHLGEGLAVGRKCSIGALAHIGRNVQLGDGCRIQGGAYIADGSILGSNVFIGPNATLLNDRYPPSKDSTKWSPVRVASGAVVGGGSTVVAGVSIGENSVLGAGATLTRNLPKNEVWVGTPARYHSTRAEYERKGGRESTTNGED